jgi:capsular polysaccharide export protein
MYLEQQRNRLNFSKKDKVLFLQGPAGSFFSRFSSYVKEKGAQTFHVNFNLGDKFFNPNKNSFDFKDNISEWPKYLENLILKKRINKIYMLNDCRPYHYNIVPLLKKLNMNFYVFEEGYFRPNHLTLEPIGVNANSKYVYFEQNLYVREIDTISMRKPFLPKFLERAIYSILSLGDKIYFKNYISFRKIDPFSKFYLETMNSIVFFKEKFTKKLYKSKKNYALIALQLNDDTQIKFHSFFENMEDYFLFLIKKIRSHRHDQEILVKSHPKDLYHASKLQHLFKDMENVHFIFEGELSDYFENANFVIVNNSTSGIQAIEKGKNIFACGNSAYLKKRYLNINEMENDLDIFLNDHKKMQPFVNLNKFKLSTQIKGKFY